MPINRGGRPPRDPNFPLRRWLRGLGLKTYRFAPKLRDKSGGAISHQRLYQYMAGRRAIPTELATRLDYLSRGAVPLRCWPLMLDDKGQYYSLGRRIDRHAAVALRTPT